MQPLAWDEEIMLKKKVCFSNLKSFLYQVNVQNVSFKVKLD